MSLRQPLSGHDLDRLTESITALSDQIEVLRDVLDEIREDLQWAVRNDRVVALPVACAEHAGVRRMALDPTSAEWGSRLETRTLKMLTGEEGVEQVRHTVESVINEVATAAVGLAWVRDQVREELDEMQEELLAGDDEPLEYEDVSPQKEGAGEPPAVGQAAEADADAGTARDSHGEGVESLADQHRPLRSPQPAGPGVQRSLFDQPEEQKPTGIVTAAAPTAETTTQVEETLPATYTLGDYRAFRERLDGRDVGLDELKAEFRRVREGSESFVAALKQRTNAGQLQALAVRFGCLDARRNNKQDNAQHVYRAVLQSFLPGGSIQFNPMQETLEEAVARRVEGLSDEDWQRHLAEREERQRAEQKALENPETLDEFRIRVRERGVESLSEEQRVRFDELSADASRAARAAKQTQTVSRVSAAGAEGLQLSVKAGWHDKRQCPLWIVQLAERVDRELFHELKRKAKMLDGWYSSFKKSDAGFQFTSEEHARRFASLLEGDADRSDVLAERKTRNMETAGGRLAGVADTLDAEAEEILAADETRLQNTVRRADMAAGMRGRAYANQAMAGTLRSIAAALDEGEAAYLDGVRAATHVTTLVTLLRRAKQRRSEALLAERGELGPSERHRATEELSIRPPAIEDAAYAQYPYPSLSRSELQSLVSKAAGTKGLKQLSRRMQPFLVTDRERHVVEFVDEHDTAFAIDYLRRCRRAGLDTRWLDAGLEDFQRLRAANVHTPQELRCVLRALVPHLRRKQDDDPVRKAERDLLGVDIPGFFPTPAPVIARMLEIAEIEPGHRVLEPSAGKGDILDMLRQRHSEARVTAIEINGTLFDVLAAKGHDVQRGDFLEHAGQYDRIVMNPPFENGGDIDHVRHAYDQLAAGGRLVSVVSEGPFFRQDRKADEFRSWLEEIGGESEELPDDAFNGREAFRQTGVRTRIVVLHRQTDHSTTGTA